MSELDAQLVSDLQRMCPEPVRQPDWDDVMRRVDRGPRRSWRPVRLAWVAAASVVAIALAAVSVRMIQRSSSPASTSNTSIGLLDRPAGANERRPDMGAWHDSIAIAPENLRLSQRIRTQGGALDVFIGRSGAGLCLVMLTVDGTQTGDYGSCQPGDGMLDDGVVVFAQQFATVGIVADGITRARARGTEVPVVNNTFVLPAGVDPEIEVLRGGRWIWRAPHFAIFDRPQTAEEAAAARQPWVTTGAIDRAKLRIVTRGSRTFFVVWRTDALSVCLVPSNLTVSWTTACDDIDSIATAGGLPVSLPITGSNGRWSIAALVPDTVLRVRVDGVESRVSDNVAAAESTRSQPFEARRADGAWRPMLSASRTPGIELTNSNTARTRTAQDDLPPDVRARVAPAFGPPLRADSTYRAFSRDGVTFWLVLRGDGTFVISSTGQLRVDSGSTTFSGGVQVIDNAPAIKGSWPWSFGPAVAVPDGFTEVTIGATTVTVQNNLAVFASAVEGGVVTASGPDRVVTLPRPPTG